MEDEKLADKLLDRILMVLMPYDQIDVERIKAKLTVVLDDYQICPKQEALVVYTEGKNDYYLRKFLLAKAVAGRQERTLRQYKDEVGRALRGIGKDADTITADDIQVYLAKVLSRGGSKCYSQKTVALQMQRPSRDYIVITEASNVKGNLGQIEVSDQLSNGFKVAYTGSATAATINYIVIGGYMK